MSTDTPLLAEIWALYMGMMLAWCYGYQEVIVETDCLEAVQHLLGILHSFHPYYHLLQMCKQLQHRQWQCSTTHIYRVANKGAHFMATIRQYHTWGLQIFNDVPSCVVSSFLQYCNATVYLSIVRI